MKLLEKPLASAASGRSRAGAEFRDQGVGLPKSDERKIVMACLLREKTSVSNDWIASRLAMGHPGSVSRLISAGRTDKNVARKRNELAEILFAEKEPRQ